MKKLLLTILFSLTTAFSYAQSPLECAGEPDGNPYVWATCAPGLLFPNGTVTNNNDGTITVDTSGASPTKIIDSDASTKVDVEESADEDKIRFDTAGTEHMVIDNDTSSAELITVTDPRSISGNSATGTSGIKINGTYTSNDAVNAQTVYGINSNISCAGVSGKLFNQCNGLYFSSAYTGGDTVSGIYGIQGLAAINTGGASATSLYGLSALLSMGSSGAGNITVTNGYGIYLDTNVIKNFGNTTLTNLYGMLIATPSISAGATVSNKWGIYQQDTATNNYFAGPVGVNDASIGTKLDVTVTNSDNVSAVNLTQNDSTNNKSVIEINNAGTGNEENLTNSNTGTTPIEINMYKSKTSPGTLEDIARITHSNKDSAGNIETMSAITFRNGINTNGNEAAQMGLSVMSNGVLTELMTFNGDTFSLGLDLITMGTYIKFATSKYIKIVTGQNVFCSDSAPLACESFQTAGYQFTGASGTNLVTIDAGGAGILTKGAGAGIDTEGTGTALRVGGVNAGPITIGNATNTTSLTMSSDYSVLLSNINSLTATSGNILVGDDNGFNSVTMTGDVTVASNGTATVVAENISLEELSDVNKATATAGNLLMADGASFNSVTLAGDIQSSGSNGNLQIRSGTIIATDTSFINSATASSAGRILVSDSNAFNSVTMAGDCTVSSLGAMNCTNGTSITSGTYTPTLTNVTNVTASTAYLSQYLRVGSVVTVSGKVDIDTTLAASSATELGISLPVASNFAAEEDLGGTGTSDAVASLSARIKADGTNDRASLVEKSISLTNDSYAYSFTYLIK